MIAIPGQRSLYSYQRAFAEAIEQEFVTLYQRIVVILVRYTDETGKVRESALHHVLREAGNEVQLFFVGNDFRQPFGSDGIEPLAPYPRLLNEALVGVTLAVAEHQATFMLQHLPPELVIWLKSYYTLNREFRPNPLAQYEPPHTWVDPKGYRLSDRIWQTSIATRTRIDAMLTDAIRTGQGTADLARDLEQFLLPSRQGITTTKPYGKKASFDAMRLARTEIGRAHAEATFAAARANPFADGMDWKLSLSHPKFDICDRLATIGMTGERLRDPYPLANAKQVIKDSHPQCLCVNITTSQKSIAETVADLREMLRRYPQQPPITPIDPEAFTRRLLGPRLVTLALGQLKVLANFFTGY